jgi:hypothetical protein
MSLQPGWRTFKKMMKFWLSPHGPEAASRRMKEICMGWGGKYQRTHDEYRAIPQGWDAESLLAEHRRLNGRGSIELGASMADLSPHRRYLRTMYYIAEKLETGDLASIELAVRYIELHYIGSYAGYIRALLARRLKHAPLSREQRARLARHFYGLLKTEERCGEFSVYISLWRRIIAPGEILAVKSLVDERGPQDKAFGEKLLQRLGIGTRSGRPDRPRPATDLDA